MLWQQTELILNTQKLKISMEWKDYLEMKQLNGGGLSTYEQFKVGDLQRRNHTSGVGVAGLVTGIAGAIVGVGAWIFAPIYANAKGNQAKEAAYSAKELAAAQYTAALQLMNTQNANTNATIDRLLTGLQRETDARVAQGTTISQSITDSISGQQQGSQTLTNSIENSAMAQAQAQLLTQSLLGNLNQNAQRVQLETPPQAFKCGCGCNG